ncbi:hypothetical protein PILCRDRAFT_16626 [Piloderma croceum F 1598]|uniref:Uncharacterized protein n=1 Tax=Piloderma croceum (strain F 1598) TaxID=765440 RepID=A0A0C3EV34_PILCF|nr:hypothetical protein PILCRDRAFT_16626 [Piloderma croceum F 1598]
MSNKEGNVNVQVGSNPIGLLPSTSLLCRLSASLQAKNNNVEIQTDDLRTFDVLERDVKKVEAAMKLFSKAKAAQELAILSEDNNA